MCVITQTHRQIHTGTVAFVSTGLFSASRKINALLSKMSCRPHKSRLLGSCALPPPTLPYYSSKGEMQRVIIIRQGQITGLGGGWLRSIKGCFLGNQGRCWEAGAGDPKWVGVGSSRRVTRPLCLVQWEKFREPGMEGSWPSNPQPQAHS